MKKTVIILFVLFLNPFSAPENSFSSVEEIEMQIQKIKEEIAEEEKNWAEEKSAEAEKEKNRSLSYDKFKNEKQEIEKGIIQFEKEIQEEISSFESLKQKEAEYEIRFKRFLAEIDSKIDDLKDRLDISIPYEKNKRLESIAILKEDLNSGNISMEEAFNRLYVNYENENRLAEESEVYSGDFNEPNGNVFQVNYLRLGKMIMAFSSPDGARLGLLAQKDTAKYEWIRENEMNAETRKHLRKAIATADDKAVPAFVPVPVFTESFKPDSKEDDELQLN